MLFHCTRNSHTNDPISGCYGIGTAPKLLRTTFFMNFTRGRGSSGEVLHLQRFTRGLPSSRDMVPDRTQSVKAKNS